MGAPKKITTSQALAANPEFMHLHLRRQFLMNCVRCGSGAWKKVQPVGFFFPPMVSLYRKADLPVSMPVFTMYRT